VVIAMRQMTRRSRHGSATVGIGRGHRGKGPIPGGKWMLMKNTPPAKPFD
jgi:hypothetical protein